MLEYLVFVAAFASILATFVYMRSMLKGSTKPNRVSWLMWTIAPLIATAAAISNGVGWAVLPVFMAGFSPLLILAASFVIRKSYWKLSPSDYICGLLSSLALILWYFTKDPNVAIFFAIVSDGLASVPTLTKAWSRPETESAWPYIVGVFNSLTSFGAAKLWTFSEYAFPTYLAAINIILSLAVYNKKLSTLQTNR